MWSIFNCKSFFLSLQVQPGKPSQPEPGSGATIEESVGGGLDRQLGVEVAGRQGAGGVKGGAVTHRHQLRQSGPTGGAVQCSVVL